MSRRLDGGSQIADVRAAPAPKRIRTTKRNTMIALGAISLVLFFGGMLAFFVTRDDKLCPDGKPPVQQRSEVIGSTEYLCHNGDVVTK
jgi:hypothetical protein